MGIERINSLVTSHFSDQISKRNLLVTKVTKSLKVQDDTKRDRRNYSGRAARDRADYLATKLKNPSRRQFYLKCAWNLTDAYLDRLLAISLTKKDPIRYFSAAASREIAGNN